MNKNLEFSAWDNRTQLHNISYLKKQEQTRDLMRLKGYQSFFKPFVPLLVVYQDNHKHVDRGCGVRIYIVEEKPLALGGGSAVYGKNTTVILMCCYQWSSLCMCPLAWQLKNKVTCVKTLHWYTVLAYSWITSNFQQFLNLKKNKHCSVLTSPKPLLQHVFHAYLG